MPPAGEAVRSLFLDEAEPTAGGDCCDEQLLDVAGDCGSLPERPARPPWLRRLLRLAAAAALALAAAPVGLAATPALRALLRSGRGREVERGSVEMRRMAAENALAYWEKRQHDVWKEFDETAVMQARCAVDSGQAVLRLAQFATEIKASVGLCKDTRTPKHKAFCAGVVSAVIVNFAFTGAMISAAVSDCVATINEESQMAGCSAASLSLLGNLAQISASAAFMRDSCVLWWKHVSVPMSGVTSTWFPTVPPPPTRPEFTLPPAKKPPPWLPTLVPPLFSTIAPPALWFNNHKMEDQQTDTVRCWWSTSEAVAMLMRAGLTFADSMQKCDPEWQGKTHSVGYRCAADVFGIISALSIAANFLSVAVLTCSGLLFENDPDAEAKCVASITGVIGGTAGAFSSGFVFPVACNKSKVGHSSVYTNPVFAQGRRLQEPLG